MLKFLTHLAMLGLPAIAAAQDCTIFDDMAICSDGTSATQVGDNTFFSDGSSATQIGDTKFYDDGFTATDIGAPPFTATARHRRRSATRPSSMMVPLAYR